MTSKILLITSTFPRYEGDSQVPWLAKLVKEIKRRGLAVDILAPSYRGSQFQNSYYGINVWRFRYAPKSWEILTHERGAVSQLRSKPWLYPIACLYIFFGILTLIRLLKKQRYQIVHVHWPFPQGIFGVVAKLLNGAKLILSFYGAEFTLMRRIPGGRLIMRQIILAANRLTAISSFTKFEIQKLINVPVIIIPFGSTVFVKSAKVGNIITKKNTQKKILFVGRLIERKGLVYLLEAMTQVCKSIKVHLDIVGNGPLFTDLHDKITRLNLETKISLHGLVSAETLAQFYQQCDIFVLPSIVDHWGDTEGLGVVLLEAMQYKKPVVASAVGGIDNIVKNNKTGILVNQKNPTELAQAIIKFLKNPQLAKQCGQAGFVYVRQHFSWEKIIKQTVDLYEECANN